MGTYRIVERNFDGKIIFCPQILKSIFFYTYWSGWVNESDNPYGFDSLESAKNFIEIEEQKKINNILKIHNL